MNLKLIAILLIFSYALVGSKAVESNNESENFKHKQFSKIKEHFGTLLKDIHESYVYLEKTSSGRKPCIWKICSKPLKKDRLDDGTNYLRDFKDNLLNYLKQIKSDLNKIRKKFD